ncbi:MAG: cupin-like domain-containing protein [Pseudomonadota bacterium]
MDQISVWKNVDVDTFHNDIVPSGKPAVMRSLFSDWPAVQHACTSDESICSYLASADNGTPVYTIAAPPEARGRFFYSTDLQGVNFRRAQIPLAQVLSQLQSAKAGTQSFSLAVQALQVLETLPQFAVDNPQKLLDDDIAPTMWIGNRGQVAPHYDVHRNLACVVAGKRQFVLFPPEQVSSLYPGPMLGAPGGVPISMVDVWDPDLDRFPQFSAALETALEAVLEPGDAIYIPSLWWHGVASLEAVNVLVNYWWDGIGDAQVSPNDTLMHGLLSIAKLDQTQRRAWRAYFDHYVFREDNDPTEHLPTNLDDLVTTPNAEQTSTVKDFLSENLKKKP